LPEQGSGGSGFPFLEESDPDESAGLLEEDRTSKLDMASRGSFIFFLLLSASRFPVAASAMGQETPGKGLRQVSLQLHPPKGQKEIHVLS
jgi:hypothetical protein